MSNDLIINFSSAKQFTISLNGNSSKSLEFSAPIILDHFDELKWYLEKYPSQSLGKEDDDRAARQLVQLKQLGKALFSSVFYGAALQYFDRLLNAKQLGRTLTINASQPEILELPWELMVSGEAYIFNEKISVRRNLSQIMEGQSPIYFEKKKKLRILRIVSRSIESFVDPYRESHAVMDAIDQHGQGRIVVEFLRPGTLAALVERLECEELPPIDILHFNGHGVFDGQMGCLKFETDEGKEDIVPADRLGQLLHQQGLGLVVLSACQSSMVGRETSEDTAGVIGSVAARLTQTGVPAVLAMSYEVLVNSMAILFGRFYGKLARGKGIGESLDNARRQLLLDPIRGQRLRGKESFTLTLHDWFVPTLYQSGIDSGMLDHLIGVEDEQNPRTLLIGRDMPKEHEVGFFGRRLELWKIERAFTPNLTDKRKETRRITIAGFGGQGKTVLAAKVGQWLVRTGMFEAVVFVNYHAFQGIDAIPFAVSTIALDLDMTLIDAGAVTKELIKRRVLVILDNLEDLKADAQRDLLGAAVNWSKAGQSRVLITTRQDDLGHEEYGASGFEHQLLVLKGLEVKKAIQINGKHEETGFDDAIDYFYALMQRPPQVAGLPSRGNLIKLFEMVDFHPLSIAVLAEQLRSQNIMDVTLKLKSLLENDLADVVADRGLVASLTLSLNRLDADLRQLIRRLGVFQGGAMEAELLAVAEFTPEQWQQLRQQLLSAGLMQAEIIGAGVSMPFLKFHPTLARVLWGNLSEEEQGVLQQRHREQYYALSGYLYNEDRKNPCAARAIAKRELPNLLVAVRGTLTAGEEWAVEFMDNVNKFLGNFGMNGDRTDLTQRAEKAVQSVAVGSQAWYLARTNVGGQLWQSGYPQQAKEIFEEILLGLGEMVSYDRGQTLAWLGRCWKAMGQPAQAVTLYRQALAVLVQLGSRDDGVKRQIGATQSDLGDVLRQVGDYEAARQAYETSLAISMELNDKRGVAVSNGQLGTLAMFEGDLGKAEKLCNIAIETFQELDESEHTAIYLHQLGMVYEKDKAWERAEQTYRAAAKLWDEQGNLANAAKTANQLAIVYAFSRKPKEAEDWFRKAIENDRKVGNPLYLARHLSNLASLLQNQGNFSEAHQLAEESLILRQTLDPAAAEIWVTYTLLAQIATQQGNVAKAKDYSRQSRQSYVALTAAQQMLQQNEEFIQVLVAAICDAKVRHQLEKELPKLKPLNKAIHQILVGVRDEDELCDELSYTEEAIICETLKRLRL
jgi:tetratricopeptide (TPR) repeat protein